MQYKTPDLPLAAYLIMRGLKLVSAQKAPSGKFEFIIEDPDGKAPILSIEYINSEFCKFDNQIRTLKKILYTK